MGNFLSQLAKGFVRSAVNQVGRDTGKVISNQFFGDAHSTPIRHVTTSDGLYYLDESKTPMSDDDVLNAFSREKVKRNIHRWGCLATVFKAFMSNLVAIQSAVGAYLCFSASSASEIAITISSAMILPFLWAIYGYKLRNRKFIYTEIQKEIPTYIADRRCKNGMRYNGHQIIFETIKMPALQHERSKMKREGAIYIAISILPFLISLIVNILK